MSRRARVVLFALAAAGLGALLVWAVADLPAPEAAPGRSALLSTSVALHERHAQDTVAGITFDLRGIDTLGEELILFVAAIGSTVLLRASRREEDAKRAERGAEADERMPVTAPLRALGAFLVGPVLVLGVYIVAHGHLSPGGGFQGGVILAAALLLAYAAGQVVAVERVRPVEAVELTDALGAAAYALVAIGGLVFASAAMANFLALGVTGHLLSSGTILLLEVCVGVEVTAALTLIFTEFLDQALMREA